MFTEKRDTEQLVINALQRNPGNIPTLLELVLLEDQYSRVKPLMQFLTSSLGVADPGFPATLLQFWEHAAKTILQSAHHEPTLARLLVGQARSITEEVAKALELRLIVNGPPFAYAVLIPQSSRVSQAQRRPESLTTLEPPTRTKGRVQIRIKWTGAPVDGNTLVRSTERRWSRMAMFTGGRVVERNMAVVARCPAFVGHALIAFPPWVGFPYRLRAVATFALGQGIIQITGDALPTVSDWMLDAFKWVCRTFTVPPPIDIGPAPLERVRACGLTSEAYVAIERRDWTTAKQKLLDALTLWEAAPDTHSELALVYQHEGNLVAAELHLRRAIELSPNSAKFHVNLATCLLRQGRLLEARQAVEKALSIDPTYPSARSMLLFLVRAGKSATS